MIMNSWHHLQMWTASGTGLATICAIVYNLLKYVLLSLTLCQYCQGSILRPLLFLIYINDNNTILKSLPSSLVTSLL